MKKWTKLMAIALSLVIIVSAITGGVVLADDPADSRQITPPRGGMMRGACELTELLGLTAEEIHAQRLDGISLAQIAAVHGVSEAELVAVTTGGIAERLAQAVSDGKLTQAQANEMLYKVTERVTKMVQSTKMPLPWQRQPRKQQANSFQRGFKAGMQATEVSELLGLTAGEIHAQRLDGASLAQIAAAQGVAEAELVAALTDGITERLVQTVSEGKITQEQADKMLLKVTERTVEMMQSIETGKPNQLQSRSGRCTRGG